MYLAALWGKAMDAMASARRQPRRGPGVIRGRYAALGPVPPG